MNKIRLAIADDHLLFRKTLVSYLENLCNYKVVVEAGNGEDLVNQLQNNLPDILLLDLRMPIISGLDVLSIIRERHSELRIIILSMDNSYTTIAECLLNGADAYLTKDCLPEELEKMLLEVLNNRKYYYKNLTFQIVEEMKNLYIFNKRHNLTKRETEIIKCLCQGLSHKQIAARLFIEIRTVAFHKANIYKKTNTFCNVSLYKFAQAKGLID